ncbi:hypothetical protein Pcinc_022617 [Petrolisthes cinctipes]|uniref:BTB domain-containing protein n=1 Tax=Petrolisthes cinctipes TaxID=88211 RepID=A0AAE1FF90_PETCI|nr:hypothetical protein Pcinc_022617 [Petrolisthes cinctipes]
MKDVTSRDLEALLDFMYNGEVNVPQSSLGSLIKTAEGLQIKGLAVPDDPPAPKRERDREKRENRTQLDHHHHSPPAKRPRPRERSPPHTSPSQQSSIPVSSNSQVSRSRSPPPPIPPVGASQMNMPPVEATLDEDSRTSVQSGVSGLSEHNSSTTPSLSSKQASGSTSSQVQQQQQQQHNPDDTTHQDPLTHGHTGGEEPSPGPSGLHKSQQPQQSKEEPEFEIKQEDVVELGEDDEGDWGVEGDGGGGESSVGADNPPNFPEVMLPHSDGSMPPTGDPAMLLGPFSSVAAASLSPAGHIPLPAARQPGSHTLFGALAAKLGAPPSSSSSSPPSPLMGGSLGSGTYRAQQVGRGRYRQDRIRAQMNMLKAETASMESLLESGVLGEAEAAHLEAQLSGKRSETEQMQKELERLISGQLRQRKFREKMKKMNAAAAAASQGQYQEAKWC